jgi:uncharacterized tellurite resistance protein B-like protein
MISKLKSILLGNAAFTATAANENDRKQLALAALLVEMARADFDEHQAEHGEIAHLLAAHFELSSAEAHSLIDKGQAANNKAACLFDFTRALHQCLNIDEKRDVIRMLWKVANADRTLDKYEDYLVHKIADLLYLSHHDVMRLKHEVADSL